LTKWTADTLLSLSCKAIVHAGQLHF